MKFSFSTLALALALTSADHGYHGAPLEYTLFGNETAGSCVYSDPPTNVVATGRTLSLDVKGDNFLCETDEMITNGANITIYTKIESKSCGDQLASYTLYNCDSNDCTSCTLELEGVINVDHVKDLYNSPVACFQWLGDVQDGTPYEDLPVQSAMAFNYTASADDTKEYWDVLFKNTCGETWTQRAQTVSAGFSLSVSTVAFAAPIAALLFQ